MEMSSCSQKIPSSTLINGGEGYQGLIRRFFKYGGSRQWNLVSARPSVTGGAGAALWQPELGLSLCVHATRKLDVSLTSLL